MQSTMNGYTTVSNGDNGYTLPTDLLDPGYYTTDKMRRHFHRLRWPVDKISTTIPPRLLTKVHGGPFDRSLLREIVIANTEGTTFAHLFAKIQDQRRHVILGPSGESQQSLAKRVEYEGLNLQYWNILGLPSPYLFEIIRDEVSPASDAQKHEVFTLLMTRIGAPTHDLDVLAIDNTIHAYKNRLGSRFVEDEEKEQIPVHVRQLEKERERIISSILRTQVRCQLLGTHHLDGIAEKLGLTPKRPTDPVAEELKATSHYLRVVHLYKLVQSGNLSIQTARKNELSPEEEQRLHKKIGDISTALKPVLEALYADASLLRYIHGDEYPHHYAYKARKEGEALHTARTLGEPIQLNSSMLDANDARIGLPESGLAKTLLSYILNLPHEKVHYFLHQHYETVPKTAKFYEQCSKPRRGILQLVPKYTEEEFLDRFDLTGITISLRNIGLKTKDKVFNHERFDSFVNQVRDYNAAEGFVNFPKSQTPSVPSPPKTVSYEPYSSENAIPLLQKFLRERVTSFLFRHRRKNSYQSLEEHVRALDTHFKTYEIYSS